MVPENVVDGCGNDSLQEEPFPGPDNQSKMKRSVENAEHVGLFIPTAGQYFRNERRRRHSQYDGGRASSFQPFGQRFKGNNALVFYPEGSPTVAGALSQDMDISHRIEVCDTPAPSLVELGNYITQISHRTCFTNSPNLQITFLNIFPDTLGDSSSPTYWVTGRPKRVAPTNLRGSEARGRTRCPNHPAPIPVARRVSVGPGSRGPHEERLARVQRVEGTEHRIERSMDVMVAARRSMYGADMLPRTTNFGVTPEDARELHQNQHRSDPKLVCLGLPGGCMMLSSFFWSVRFYVIVGGAEHIIYFFPTPPTSGLPPRRPWSSTRSSRLTTLRTPLLIAVVACSHTSALLLSSQRHPSTGLNLKSSLSFSKSTGKPVMISKSATRPRPIITSTSILPYLPSFLHQHPCLVPSTSLPSSSSSLPLFYIYCSLPDQIAALKPHGVLSHHFTYIHTAWPTAALKPHGLCPLDNLYIHRAIDRSIEAPRGLPLINIYTTARPIAALKPHGSCPRGSRAVIFWSAREPTSNSTISGLTMDLCTCSLSHIQDHDTSSACFNGRADGHFSRGKLEKPTLVQLSIPALDQTLLIVMTIALDRLDLSPFSMPSQPEIEANLPHDSSTRTIHWPSMATLSSALYPSRDQLGGDHHQLYSFGSLPLSYLTIHFFDYGWPLHRQLTSHLDHLQLSLYVPDKAMRDL
ncbi:uncharacterized protein FMAN_00181 [Fusarium mangiferae]|uniref:Uncharacterized protein n=1 Tax=Fusarium mangiferae TaxID=192010 RepID=A0A1L7TXB8_FUSMA|nr:uncharacterized protein FMAN_00181 [Fusarium mangiferae]CVL02679.1 uncharacterized protein FMAN_00181 [Fusarium mangiferae]